MLFKCHLCGTLYMGPPLGHVRDPEKQSRFVEAELAALLQAAGGTLPVIKKNERGVYVIVEPEGAAPAHAAGCEACGGSGCDDRGKSGRDTCVNAGREAMAPPAAKPTGEPDRSLNRRSTYAGFKDTGPVAGETKEQKIARLAQLVEAVRKRTEEGGGPEHAAPASAAPLSEAAATASPVAGAETPADLAPDSVAPATQPTSTSSPEPSGDPNRSLMRRATYAGVTDTGPVAGETPEQKIARLAALVEAVKQRNTGG